LIAPSELKGQSKKDKPEELTTMVTGQINGREYRRPKGQSKKDNPEELTTMVTGQINVREYRRPKGQSKKDNPEELTTMVTGQINGGEDRPVTSVVCSSVLSFFDCPFGLRYSPPFICPVTIVVSSSGLSFFDCPFGLRYSLTFICPVTSKDHKSYGPAAKPPAAHAGRVVDRHFCLLCAYIHYSMFYFLYLDVYFIFSDFTDAHGRLRVQQ
jgi:hypothetical protein